MPNNSNDSNDSEIIDFYKGRKNKNKVSLEDIWNLDYKDLEHIHNYIQWLFPIVEPSYWNRDTPKLSEEDIVLFKTSEDLKIKLLTSLEVILDFWGLKINYYSDSIVVSKSKNYEQRKDNWQSLKNHNLLRVTRVLHCLNDCGLRKTSEAFFSCLMEIVEESPERFSDMTKSYWKNAMVLNMQGGIY